MARTASLWAGLLLRPGIRVGKRRACRPGRSSDRSSAGCGLASGRLVRTAGPPGHGASGALPDGADAGVGQVEVSRPLLAVVRALPLPVDGRAVIADAAGEPLVEFQR